MNDLRFISFLPSATEMICALGLEEQLVGITHKCDFPASVQKKPVVVRSALALENMTMQEIDVAVSECMRDGGSLYVVDEQLLEKLAPTHILTQVLCQVCAPSGNEITRALKALPSKPEVVWLTPHTIEEIFDNLRELGQVAARSGEADEVIRFARLRMQMVAETVRHERKPRVLCLEWTDPYYCCGHWVPEMVEIAGGQDALGRKGTDSVRIPWAEIAAWAPEVLIVTPCGFSTAKAVHLAKQLLSQDAWAGIPAVQNGRVFAVDANAYFARPAMRVIDGIELLAHLFQPNICSWHGPADAFCSVRLEDALAPKPLVKIG